VGHFADWGLKAAAARLYAAVPSSNKRCRVYTEAGPTGFQGEPSRRAMIGCPGLFLTGVNWDNFLRREAAKHVLVRAKTRN
jgi:hypothetical protein